MTLPASGEECAVPRDTVVIAIATFRRPQSLRRLLEAIAALETGAHVSILVADHDAVEQAGLHLCRSLVPGYRWPLQAVIVRQRGTGPARNMLIEAALKNRAARYIAMIEDDQWPAPQWIDAFLRIARDTSADVLQGPVCLIDPSHGGRRRQDLERKDIRRPSGPVAELAGLRNLLIRREALEALAAPAPEPQAGTDSEFFTRLAGQGRRLAWADDAVVQGEIPRVPARLSKMMARAYRIGNSDMRRRLQHRTGPVLIVAELCKIAVILLLSPLAAVILAASPSRRLGPLRRMCRAAGKLTAMFGVRTDEHAALHGQ